MTKNKKQQKTPSSHPAHKAANSRKKETVLGNADQKGTFIPILVAVVLVAVVAGGYALYNRPSTAHSTAAPSAVPTADLRQTPTTGTVTYPVALFEDGRARHFDFEDGDRTIRYFVIKSADGVIRAAFDACDVCWPSGKGYYQEGDHMVCRNCGRKFATDQVNEVEGGCNPAPLERNVANGMLVIRADDIRDGAGYFDFKGKG